MAAAIGRIRFNNQFGINYNSGNGTNLFLIPTTAQYLVVVLRDDYYQDNFDQSGTFGVDISIQNPVPEPATYAMMLGGLGLLAGWRRLRRS